MKVVLVSRFPRDIDRPHGGVETATVGLARALMGAGVDELHIVTLEHDLGSDLKCETHEGIHVHRLPRSSFPMMLDVFFGPSTTRLNKYIDQLAPDVVHFQETWGFGSRRCNFPSVFTVHGFDSLNLPTEQAKGWKLRAYLWRLAEKMGMMAQTHVVSIAPYVKKEIEPLTQANIYDIWNSLDDKYFQLETSPESNRVLFLGWINPRKNPLVLIEAAAKLLPKIPDLKIDLCGAESDPEYAVIVKQRIDELGVGDSVKLLGSIAQSEVKEKFMAASLLVLPSLQENAPMVIAEAMAAGVPVVASNLCGIPDMVSNGTSGILIDNPHDADELASAMEKLLLDEDKRAQMIASAKDEAYKKFHPSEVAKATLDVYRAVISANKEQ